MKRQSVLALVGLVLLPTIRVNLANAEHNTRPIVSQQQIVGSTWSMYVWRVLGWQYNGPFWTRGVEEKGRIGHKGQTDKDETVRAVCLGEESGFYVFFTLRSFVAPAFPNLFIQGVEGMPIDLDGSAFSQSAIEGESHLRYGELSLVLYEDMGGGIVKIKAKAGGVTHLDAKNPKCYGRRRVSRYLRPNFYETIDDVKYERPHKRISARKHLKLQKEPRITIKFVDDHDVALLYVPKSAFTKGAILTLGMSNPTLSVRLMLEHNRELFGFKFVLIGQETLDSIKNYTPSEDNPNFRGFQKLLTVVAGLALSRETLQMVLSVDRALDRALPRSTLDGIMDAKDRLEPGEVAWAYATSWMRTIIEDVDVITKIREHLMLRISTPRQ